MYIYKYYPLFEGEEESDKRLVLLENKLLWMSRYEYLNDPTEYAYFIRGNTIFDKMCADVGDILIASFSRRFNGLPMWAHYANNHRGFVVEFKTNSSKNNNLYKVKYIKKPLKISEIGQSRDKNCDNIRDKYEKIFLGQDEKNIIETFYNGAVISSKVKLEICRIKHDDWKYENEYRLIIPAGMNFLDDNVISFNYAKIQPTHIYAGMKCSLKNIRKLEKLSRIWAIGEPKQIMIEDFYINNS